MLISLLHIIPPSLPALSLSSFRHSFLLAFLPSYLFPRPLHYSFLTLISIMHPYYFHSQCSLLSLHLSLLYFQCSLLSLHLSPFTSPLSNQCSLLSLDLSLVSEKRGVLSYNGMRLALGDDLPGSSIDDMLTIAIEVLTC